MSEPTPGELSRRLDEIRTDIRDGNAALNSRLDRLVSVESHHADMRRIEEQVAAVAKDVTEAEARTTAAVATERQAREKAFANLTAQMERTAVWLRWVAATVVLPVVLFIFQLAVDTGAAPTP